MKKPFALTRRKLYKRLKIGRRENDNSLKCFILKRLLYNKHNAEVNILHTFKNKNWA